MGFSKKHLLRFMLLKMKKENNIMKAAFEEEVRNSESFDYG